MNDSFLIVISEGSAELVVVHLFVGVLLLPPHLTELLWVQDPGHTLNQTIIIEAQMSLYR